MKLSNAATGIVNGSAIRTATGTELPVDLPFRTVTGTATGTELLVDLPLELSLE